MSSPAVSTIKRLFAVSGNQCAFPKCPLTLVDEATGKVTGRICHIKARKTGGPRFDPTQADEKRHDFSNLLLLCPIHHDVIDSDPEAYTVERLTKIKSEHEQAAELTATSDEVAKKLIMISFKDSSSAMSLNQQGGQTATHITNLLLQSDAATNFESEMQRKRYQHDVEIFRRADSILDEQGLDLGLDVVGGDHSYRESFYCSIIEFARFFERIQNEYLDSELHSLSGDLAKSLRRLNLFLGTHFFIYPEHRNFEDTRYCLYPDLNIDRAGKGEPGEAGKYDEFAEQLNEIVTEVWETFQKYRKRVKVALLV